MTAITPQARALLNTISKAEGTWGNGAPRYDITFGYQKVDSSKPHPGRVVRGGRYASDATGAYQFLSTTWKGVNGGNLPMTPQNQDRAALELVRRRGVDPNAPLTPQALAKLAPEWASLPTLAGKSYYGQPVKRREDLLSFYNQQLKAGANPAAPAAAPAAAAAPVATPASGGEIPLAGGAGGGLDLSVLAALSGNGGGGAATPLALAAQASQKNYEAVMADLDRSFHVERPELAAPLAHRRLAASAEFLLSPLLDLMA